MENNKDTYSYNNSKHNYRYVLPNWFSYYPIYYDIETINYINERLEKFKKILIKKFGNDIINILKFIKENFRNLIFISYRLSYK